ncbi:hypothetical protein ZTR_09121 [Talaromyces verruculosus]|nr:hypothetical protein ZTR_09121 [Talaromyces verruculosus]
MSFTLHDPDTDSIASFRYLLVDFEAEDFEKYRPGGFHPVHLEDVYDNNRYKVVHKLDAGDMTTANIVFGLLGIEKYSEHDLYRMFGTPEYQTLETESGEPTGPEALDT